MDSALSPMMPAGGLGERRVEAYEVGLREDAIQRAQLDAQHAGVLRGNEWVVAQDAHTEAARPVRHLGADLAKANDAQYPVAYLDAGERAAGPLAAP